MSPTERQPKLFVVDDSTNQLVVNPKVLAENRPQNQVYAGKSPEERWQLEHQEPDDGVYRGGN